MLEDPSIPLSPHCPSPYFEPVSVADIRCIAALWTSFALLVRKGDAKVAVHRQGQLYDAQPSESRFSAALRKKDVMRTEMPIALALFPIELVPHSSAATHRHRRAKCSPTVNTTPSTVKK